MTVSPVFNRMLVASQIEEQATASLKQWFPTYLREVERQIGLPASTLKIPRNFSDRNSFEMDSPAEQLPKVVVIAPGIIGTPAKTGGGSYNATWRVGVGVAVAANTEKRANELVKGYGASIRAIMLQNSGMTDLGGTDVRWISEAYDDIPLPNQTRLLKAASLYFDIDFADVVTRGGGPDVPDAPPYDYGEVQTVDIVIEEV